MRAVWVLIFVLIPFSAASVVAQTQCTCVRTNDLEEPTPGGTCAGGARCDQVHLENHVPVPEGEENGRCQATEPCQATSKPCKFDSYTLRVSSSGCASACAGGYTVLSVAYSTPSGATGSGTMPAQSGWYPPWGTPGLAFAVADQACDTKPIVAHVTISAAGIVFMVTRTCSCSQCIKLANG